MRQIHLVILAVSVVTGIIGAFGLAGDWGAMMDFIDQIVGFINENAAYPALVFAAVGLAIGGGVIPPAINIIASHVFRKKDVEGFKKEFAELAGERAALRRFINRSYKKNRVNEPSQRVSDFLSTTTVPESLPLEESGSLLEWANSVPDQLDDHSQAMWKFVCWIVYEENEDADKLRSIVSKFWDKWGYKVRSKHLKTSDIAPQLRANAFDLVVLSYWESAQLSVAGWDEGPGKSGLFYLAHEAQKLRKENA